MKTLVERIRNRELAIENDGSLEELRKVLKHCFPKDSNISPGYLQDYYAKLGDNNKWDYGYEIDLPTVSVKEVLAEIEGESKDTKVIYLNEEDKPKIEEPLEFIDWYKKHGSCNLIEDENNISNWRVDFLNEGAAQYAQYLNNFKPNDKTIEFLEFFDEDSNVFIDANNLPNEYDVSSFAPSEFDYIHCINKSIFHCWKSGDEHNVYVFKGNLNNGKVK